MTGDRTLALAVALLAGSAVAGCSAFVAPNVARAPLKASLAAEALYGGPLKTQPRDTAGLGRSCDRAAPESCRFGDATAQRAANLGVLTLLEPSDGGAALRAPWIGWTRLYRVWDHAFAQEYHVDEYFWPSGESDAYTPLFVAFRNFAEVTRAELPFDRGRLRADLGQQSRNVLVQRIRVLQNRWQQATAGDKSALEREIRDHLELLAGSDQRADERVKRMDGPVDEEAALYAAMADATRVLAGLQRNITNHLLAQDLVLSAEEAKALAEAARERIARIREAIDAGRKAELEEQKKARLPDWAERLNEVLERVRGKGGK
jgi:hypothetical protein